MTSMPTWEEFMVPALRLLADGDIHRGNTVAAPVADALAITPEQREKLLPSGQPRFANRANWALSYLYRAGAVERPTRAHYRITDVGRQLLASHPAGLTEHDLRAVPGYVIPSNHRNAASTSPASVPESSSTIPAETAALSPTEQIEEGIERIHEELASELLGRLHDQDPVFFEDAVLSLLEAMGYPGTDGRITRTQLSRDGGIDGIVDQDALGLSRVYVQAKRYDLDAAVGRPTVQAFAGALQGNGANQGVFFTTSRFSTDARDFAEKLPTRVVLIDGARLASLMIRYHVGVQVKKTYEIGEIDEDFFAGTEL
ncbi:restriction system protein [Propionibacterium freudenreichii]|uniref:restriction endonuclease n=1 Tax=Propionibacterium freudenreichii TaxID=1744 RepID=UPI00054249C9|nr:restriction endonuclease [Propionibacterium freudenreichii]MDK9332684.1 restriction endonuclease [Propionibacterium freudenreichii]MDK9661668.1 restriction endonuclease [Propionibacterium freudenreichii]CEH04334.1 restriction system protein [Propionibacterium freudenreichii]